MKQIVFTYEGFKVTNIGDYIQSLAAKQFLTSDNEIVYIGRDDLNSYSDTSAIAIMNGWFTHRPQNWPPSSKIKPLFVATHFNSSAYSSLLSESSLAYLKRHQPIGCRDINTAEALIGKGVDAYFSSCLTTTLGMTYRPVPKEERSGIYIVDPVHFVPESSRRLGRYLFLKDYILNKRNIDLYIKSLLSNNSCNIAYKESKLKFLSQATRAYLLLSKILGKGFINKVTILTQAHDARDIPSREDRFKRAEELINIYRYAELVITSRIHCALPCLGLETPVVFLQNMDDSIESTCRFEGLLDLLNLIKFKRNNIVEAFCPLPLCPNQITNKEVYKKYANILINKCKLFIKNNS